MMTRYDLHIHDDPTALSEAVATHWVTAARESVEARDGFHVALAGGSTPRRLYELLASGDFRRAPQWHATHIYFGDERCVPPDHDDSNFRMAQESLLRHVEIPARQIHRIEAERDDREGAAREYARILKTRLPPNGEDGPPRFDLVLLGLGTDGHIASLFPETEALEEHTRLVVPVWRKRAGDWRISLTYPIINAARRIAIMVTGTEKAGIVGEVLGHPAGEARYPVERLSPRGRLEWFIDRAAASGLPKGGVR